MDAKVSLMREEKKKNPKIKNLRRLGIRGSIISLREAGHKMESISSILNCSRQTISKWLKRYKEEGLDGLCDLPRTGRRKKLNSNETKRIEKSILSLSERKKKSAGTIK